MPLLRKTLHDLRWHIVGYGGGLGMLAALYVVLYPAFAGTLADFELPEEYSAFIGDVSDLAVPRGFLQVEFFSFWMPLLVAVYAVVVSTGLLAGDEQRGTLEMMLAQPSRAAGSSWSGWRRSRSARRSSARSHRSVSSSPRPSSTCEATSRSGSWGWRPSPRCRWRWPAARSACWPGR